MSQLRKQKNRADDIAYLFIQMIILFFFFLSPRFYSYDLPEFWAWIGAFISFVGLLFFTISILNLGRALSPYITPSLKGTLITTGVYKKIRHPQYLGILLILLGLTFVFMDVSKVFMFIIALVFFHKKAIAEEKLLLISYPSYKTYKSKTGMFWPKMVN